MERLLFSCVALSFALQGGAKFLPPTPAAAAEAEPSHPWCSFRVSQLVRRRIEEEILKPAALAGIDAWPAGCPFDPSRDLFEDWRDGGKLANKTASAGICLADYCAVFGVCEGDVQQQDALDKCDSEALAKARLRCNTAVSRCFPLSGELTRRFHVQYSRQRCQVLDCDVLQERRRGHEAAPISVAALLAVLVPLITAAFAGVVLSVDLNFLVESGLASTSTARGCLQTREALRTLVGFDRTKLL